MTRRFLAVVGLLAALAVGGPAAAAAPSGYVSPAEFGNATRMTMHDMEHSLGVVGLGKVIIRQDDGDHVVREYPYCSPTGPTGVVQIAYDRNARGEYMSSAMLLILFPPDPLAHRPQQHGCP